MKSQEIVDALEFILEATQHPSVAQFEIVQAVAMVAKTAIRKAKEEK